MGELDQNRFNILKIPKFEAHVSMIPKVQYFRYQIMIFESSYGNKQVC
jgi:hypothetical protein